MARKPKDRDSHPVDEPIELVEPGKRARPLQDDDHMTWADGTTWLRGLYVLILGVLTCFAMPALGVLSLIQFIWLLATGHKNPEVAELGGKIAVWLAQAAQFGAGTTDEKPFPWRGL